MGVWYSDSLSRKAHRHDDDHGGDTYFRWRREREDEQGCPTNDLTLSTPRHYFSIAAFIKRGRGG